MPRLYTWEQTQSEVRVFVPVPQDFSFKRDVKYTVKSGRHIALTVAGKTYLDGTLGGAVDQDMAEMACTVHEENGTKGLEIQLEKQVPMPWQHCIEGEENDDEAAAPTSAATPAAAAPSPAARKSDARQAATIGFTEAAKKPPPPATRPPAAAVAAAAAQSADAGGSSTCIMCMIAGTVLGAIGYAVDHWQKNTL